MGGCALLRGGGSLLGHAFGWAESEVGERPRERSDENY